MKKKLSEMTLEELWRLFPIFLTEHKSYWSIWYEEECLNIKNNLPLESIRRISHIGSTAINNIWAKPIIDILLEIKRSYQLNNIIRYIEKSGYIVMSGIENRISFNKGYTENGFAEKVFHLHLRYESDNDEIYFRDYLNNNPDIAKEYEKLKLDLSHRYEYDRDKYTESKTDFIKTYTEKAKTLYDKKYL